ncbi:multi antimicrobial extrusion protein MatE [Mesorhizobium sp. Root157]|uniref:lipopolysaccharide biosynthesis protein n=1 Tax=Mesorhizobium sp. Root157 TaxID=1736477 RepID=UPI0006F426B9|nr:lipopolysaccharide biosynthesis protein [Mesorhizobium sp. Root157]KQZ80854.1 multi antimicrobial extrusion protein MatE [Mesorhizobium sp. Root157]
MRFSAATAADRILPRRLASRARPLFVRIDEILFGADERSEAGRMSLIAFAVRVGSAFIAFVSQVLMARWMGGFEYGIFVLVWLTVLIVGSISCLGFSSSVIRFIPEFRERAMMDELRGIVLASRYFVVAASTIIASVGALGVWLFSASIESYYLVPFLLGMVCLPMIALTDLMQGFSRAHSWALSALFPTYITRPVLILVFMVLALLFGFKPDAITATLSAIAATYVTALAQLVGLSRQLGARIPAGPAKVHFRSWIVVSLPIFLVESFYYLVTNADVLMVGFYRPPEEVAVYFATVKVLALVHFVYFAVRAGVAQRYAQFTHGSDPARLALFAKETVSWTFWPSLAMAAVVLILGEPMLALFGKEFVAGYPLLFLLVLGVVARASVGPCESLLTMSGNQNVCAAVFALTLVINVGLNVILLPPFGLWGAATATALAMMFEAAALSFTVWRKLGIAMAIFIPVRSAA